MTSDYGAIDNCVSGDVVLLGNWSVGKSSLFYRLLSGGFRYNQHLSIKDSIEFSTVFHKYHYTKNGNKVKVVMHDTADQERFKSLSRQYYRVATVFLAVYAVDDPNSLQGLYSWMKEVQFHNKAADVILVGNKNDCDRSVPLEHVKQFQQHHFIKKHIEVSAKTGQYFEELTSMIVESVYAKAEQKARPPAVSVQESGQKDKAGCAC